MPLELERQLRTRANLEITFPVSNYVIWPITLTKSLSGCPCRYEFECNFYEQVSSFGLRNYPQRELYVPLKGICSFRVSATTFYEDRNFHQGRIWAIDPF